MHMGLNFELILPKTRFESLFGFIFHFLSREFELTKSLYHGEWSIVKEYCSNEYAIITIEQNSFGV